MLPSFCNDTVTVARAPWADSRGAQVRDWARAERHEVAGCSVQVAQTYTAERGRRAQATVTGAQVLCPPGADVRAGDRLEFGGSTFEVEGEPIEVRSPFGGCDHKVVSATAARG